MKLEHLLNKIYDKYHQLQNFKIDINNYIFKFKGTNEYVYDRNVNMYDIDGIREASLKNQVPEMELIKKPDDLYVDDDVSESPSTPMINDYIEESKFDPKGIKLVLDKSEFQRRALTFQIQAGVQPKNLKRQHTLPVASKFREKRFSIMNSPVSSSKTLEPLHEIDVRQMYTKFRIKILGIQNLRMYSFDGESQTPLVRLHPTCIRVEASLHNGSAVLNCDRVITSIGLSCKDINHHFNENVRWGE